MPGKYLIDLTDPRFLGTQNQEVIEFVRRVNPFAHTDVGAVLFELFVSTMTIAPPRSASSLAIADLGSYVCRSSDMCVVWLPIPARTPARRTSSRALDEDHTHPRR